MGIVGSVFGAALGWWMLGPVGAILGVALGYLAEEQSGFIKQKNDGDGRHSRSGFLASLLILIAAVMKADGKVVKAELDFVKASLVRTFGHSQAQEALLMLRDIIKQHIPVAEVVHQIRVNVDYSSRLELLHLLYGIAVADKVLSTEEVHLIKEISVGLGVSESDYLSIANLFKDDIASAYKVLEVDENIDNEQLKKAYRKMAMRYHPDKVEHLGGDIKKSAEQRFRRVNEAYERIKKARGLK